MQRFFLHTITLAGLALVIWGARLPAFQEPRQPADQTGRQAQLERGRYLVHDVAQCVVCHSPKDARGNVVKRRLLTGSPMPAKSPYRDIDWAFYCPQLVGLPGWEKDDAIYLLRHGHRRNGRAPRPPMPTFRMTEEDATAVVEYLMSLRP